MADKKEKTNPFLTGNLLDAITLRESKGNPNALGAAGEIGLMQIMPSVLDDYNKSHKNAKLKPDDLYNPMTNRRVGDWHLSVNLPRQLGEFGIAATPEALIAAYNTGARGLSEGRKPAKGYVDEVMGYMQKSSEFDPEGEGYDYIGALAGGVKTSIDPTDGLPHWGSRDPVTGRVLKGRKHKAWDLAIQADKEMGYRTIKGLDKRYYSVPISSGKSKFTEQLAR